MFEFKSSFYSSCMPTMKFKDNIVVPFVVFSQKLKVEKNSNVNVNLGKIYELLTS